MAACDTGAAGPYAGEVAAHLRYWPHEIEADLQSRYGLDIVDFWRHAALGDDDPAERPLTGGPNETKMLRSDHAAYHGRTMQVNLFESPRQIQDRDDGRKLSRAAHDHLVSQMSGGNDPNRAPRRRAIVRTTDIDEKRKAADMRRKAVNHG
jgi:hypothetical protein